MVVSVLCGAMERDTLPSIICLKSRGAISCCLVTLRGETERPLYFGFSHVPGLLAFTSHSTSHASTTWRGINLRN